MDINEFNNSKYVEGLDNLKGKKFVYESRFGGITMGIVQDAWKTYYINKPKEFFHVRVRSTNNAVYDLNELIIED